jgi:hypothetical protein
VWFWPNEGSQAKTASANLEREDGKRGMTGSKRKERRNLQGPGESGAKAAVKARWHKSDDLRKFEK